MAARAVVANAIGFADEIVQRLAVGSVGGNVPNNGEAHAVVLQLLEEVAGLPSGEIEKGRRETLDRNGDHVDFKPIGFAQKVERVLFAAKGWTLLSNEMDRDVIERCHAQANLIAVFPAQAPADTRV